MSEIDAGIRAAEMNTSDVNRTTNFSLEPRSAITTRAARGIRGAIAIVLASAGLLFLMLAAGVMGSSRITPNPRADARSGPFVTAYGNTIQQVEYGLTPESVGVTSDGGYISLALTDSPSGVGVNWVLKLSASGRPQWQREVGCESGAPGDYALGVSAQQTPDGGYILGGGVLGCGSYPQRALVEKLDAQGRVVWAFAYPAGTADGVITKIRQTADGGYVAVGSATSSGQYAGALILKLDGGGTVQWQRKLGPTGSTAAYFNAVQQTSDGGYVAIGESSVIGGSYPYPVSVLVAAFDPSGNVRWQQSFNNVDNQGSPNGYEHALSGIQTADGGYLAAGNWSNSPGGPFPEEDSGGALLLKLGSSGNIEWQQAYNGGIYCYFNGYNTTCVLITALVYSVHQTADGGYVLAGLGNLKLDDSVPQVPWLAKVDSGGNLLWQYFYYDVYATGRPISQYFASSTPTNDGGFMALGFTEKNDITGIGELYAVKTDSGGLVGICDQQYNATPLHAIDPAMTILSPSLPVLTAVTARSNLSIRARTTSVLKNDKCPAN
jgi:hypothetical protein